MSKSEVPSVPELDQVSFDKLRQWSPLVSIDLIIQDARGHVLLGLRKNEPAMGTWFVPGGRILKDEHLDKAFERIVSKELGPHYCNYIEAVSTNLVDASFFGVFEHHYAASEHKEFNGSVHYVVLAYRLIASNNEIAELPVTQHSEWKWLDIARLANDSSVHNNVKNYFKLPLIHKDQYPILADQRVNLNELLWQTPVVSLTAQAFLFTIAFNPSIPVEYRIASVALVLLVALASLQLFTKHRASEEHCMKLLADYESKTPGYGPVHNYKKAGIKLKGFARARSFRVWFWLLWIFVAAGAWGSYLCYRDWNKAASVTTSKPCQQNS